MYATSYLRTLFLLLAFGLMQGCGSGKPTTPPVVDKGDPAPAWTGTNLVDERTIAFPAVLDGKPAVMLFWATWCPYCKAFMPYAKQIQADYVDQGVQIVTFNAKERGEGDPAAYVASLNFPMVAIADADSIAEQYDVKFIPGLMVGIAATEDCSGQWMCMRELEILGYGFLGSLIGAGIGALVGSQQPVDHWEDAQLEAVPGSSHEIPKPDGRR